MTQKPIAKPRTSPADYNEGPAAAERFKAAIGHLANVPPAAVPRPEPQPRRPAKKK